MNIIMTGRRVMMTMMMIGRRAIGCLTYRDVAIPRSLPVTSRTPISRHTSSRSRNFQLFVCGTWTDRARTITTGTRLPA
jgi:hypothetical protein